MLNDEKSNQSNRVKTQKCSVKKGGSARSARYNNSNMLEQMILIKEGFAQRLTTLRLSKEISAREMSLSMGMTANYINSIENGDNLPSMSMFFEICEELEVSPKDFFDYGQAPGKQKEEIIRHIDKLDGDKLAIIFRLIKMLE